MVDTISVVKWQEVAARCHELNPAFSEAVDRLKGAKDFSCVKVRYPFGATVINKGQFHLNHNGKVLPFGDPALPKDVLDLLDYKWQSIPLGIVTEGSFESHSQYGNTVVPYHLKRPGRTFSMLTIYDNPYLIANLWTEVAGCRSMIILPKITQRASLDALRHKYDLDFDDTKDFASQWSLLVELANSEGFQSDWYSEVLLFSKDFIAALERDVAVREHLLHGIWRYCSFPLNLRSYDFLWSLCLSQMQQNDVLPNAVIQDSMIVETAKHIVKIALQTMPGYMPATTNVAGPISELMQAFIEDYKIRYRLPTFMVLDRFDGEKPIYYTMAHHIFVHAHPVAKNYNRETVTDLIHIREIVLRFIDFIYSDASEHDLTQTLLHEKLGKVEFDFFHPKGKQGIRNDVETLCQEDPRFSWVPENINMKKTLESASGSIFFNGCIRIRPKV